MRDYTPGYTIIHIPDWFALSLFILNSLASFLIMGVFTHKIFLSLEKLRKSLNSKVDQKKIKLIPCKIKL